MQCECTEGVRCSQNPGYSLGPLGATEVRPRPASSPAGTFSPQKILPSLPDAHLNPIAHVGAKR